MRSLAVSAVLLFAAVGCATDGEDAAQPTVVTTPTLRSNGIWSGDRFTIVADPYTGPLTVPAGMRTIALRGRVVNRSDRTETFSMLLGLRLRSADGTSYRPVLALAAGDPVMDGPVPPGGDLVGLVAFNVPAGSSGPWTIGLTADVLAPPVWLPVD